MDQKVSVIEMVIALVTIISSAAGLRLFKLFYEWSYQRRSKLRQEWRSDLIKRTTVLEAELQTERKKTMELTKLIMGLRIDKAVLQEKLKQQVRDELSNNKTDTSE